MHPPAPNLPRDHANACPGNGSPSSGPELPGSPPPTCCNGGTTCCCSRPSHGWAGTPTRTTWPTGDRTARRGQRLHRAQRAHLPEPAAAVRRARRAHAGVGHVDERALPRLRAGVRGRPRARGPVPAARPTWPGRGTCGCWARSRGSTGTPAASWPPSRTRTARSASSSPRAGTRATSSSTSCCRWCPRCGRRRSGSAATTRRATCSRSWPTTGCWRSAARRRGERSPAARAATSSGRSST